MDTDFKKKLTAEFKEIISLASATPQKDWNLIWVLSAGEIDIKNTLKGQKNETRERLETGIKLVKKITSLRMRGNKQLLSLSFSASNSSLEDIRSKGPKIYYSGYNEHNLVMKKNKKDKFFENEYGFPGENIIVGPLENILHTDHQFQKFPQAMIPENKKIVIVTSAYHIPRCRRYLKKYPKKYSPSQFVFYPSKPFDLDEHKVDLEIQKIIIYSQAGVLALI